MITSNLTTEYNHHIIISKLFNNYRTYLYRNNTREYFANHNFRFLYVITGNASLNFEDGRSIFLEKGDLCFIGPNICYSITQNQSLSTILVLDINDTFLEKRTFEEYKNKYTCHFKIKELKNVSDLMGSLYLLSFSKYWDSNRTHNLIDSIIYTLKQNVNFLDVSLYNHDGSVEDAIYKITKYIKHNFNNNNIESISLYKIADNFNVNYYYLSRHFKKIVGLSYTKYILKLKLNRAVNLLINTDYKIVEISRICGFSSCNDLNSHFKNTLNITPHKFRNKFKNIDELIFKDELHNEKNIVNFFNTILNSNASTDILKKDYSISISSNTSINNINWDNTIDLNNIININKNRLILSDILNESFFTNIIINIKVENNNIYLVDKNLNLININLYEFRNLINDLNKSKYYVVLCFNYTYNSDLKQNGIKANEITSIIDIISGIIGLENFRKYTFGLNIIDLKTTLEKYSSTIIAPHICNFKNILDSKFPNKEYNWLLQLNSIEVKEDNILYKNLINKLKLYNFLPDKYLVSLTYKHSSKNFKSAINYYKEVLDDFKSHVNQNNDKEIIVGFNYDVSSISIDRNILVYYATLFCIKLFLELKIEGYQIGSLNYLLYYKRYNKKLKLYKYTHNPLGIKNLEYYLCSIIKSLGDKLVYIDNNLVITKNDNDMFILIYDDFIEYYNYIISTDTSYNNNHFKNYHFTFKNLVGKYKIIEYTLDVTNNRSNIKDEHILYISDEDKLFLEKNSMPHMCVDFKDAIDERLEYRISRRILEIKYIKLQKI